MRVEDVTPRARMTRSDRRAQLLAVGRRCFAERGYHGTSVGDLAREAGCSEAVLYQHFGGKLELFLAVLGEQARRMRERIAAAAAADPSDPLGAVLRSMDGRLVAPDVPDSLRLRSLAVTLADEPAVRSALEGIREDFVAVVEAAVWASQAEGRVRADVEPRHVVAMVAGLSFLAAFTCALGGDAELRALGPVAESLHRVLSTPEREAP